MSGCTNQEQRQFTGSCVTSSSDMQIELAHAFINLPGPCVTSTVMLLNKVRLLPVCRLPLLLKNLAAAASNTNEVITSLNPKLSKTFYI
jgi:hypothetical protein